MNSQPFAQSSVMAALVEAVSSLPEALQWQVVQWARSLQTSSEPVSWAIDQFITITPGVCGDRPHLVGHRIRVQDIVLWSDHWGLGVKIRYNQATGVTPTTPLPL